MKSKADHGVDNLNLERETEGKEPENKIRTLEEKLDNYTGRAERDRISSHGQESSDLKETNAHTEEVRMRNQPAFRITLTQFKYGVIIFWELGTIKAKT